MREWDWEQALPDYEEDVMRLWEEAEWFQDQVNYLFGVDDWREVEDWKTFSERKDFVLHKRRFGEV